MYSEPRSVFRWSQTIPECLNRQLGQLGQNCKKIDFLLVGQITKQRSKSESTQRNKLWSVFGLRLRAQDPPRP